MSVPVGITVPKLLPITGTFAPAFAIYSAILALRVTKERVDSEQWIGEKKEKEAASSAGSDTLYIASRCHQNFAENVPLALFLGAVVEMNGGNRKVLTGGLAALLVFRIVHSEFGLKMKDDKGNEGMGVGRPIGYFGTLGFVIGMGSYAGYLVKGYWGL